MAHLSPNESKMNSLVISSLNLFNAESVDVCVKPESHKQYHPQKLLSENIYFKIYFSDDNFIDLTSTFIGLLVIVKKNLKIKTNLYRQISV